jgi:hypothetical protein
LYRTKISKFYLFNIDSLLVEHKDLKVLPVQYWFPEHIDLKVLPVEYSFPACKSTKISKFYLFSIDSLLVEHIL